MSLPLRAKISLLWRLFRDPRVPPLPRAILPVVVAYLAFPFDIIPDFIPVLGQLDDLVVVAGGLWLILRLTPRPVIERHLDAIE